MIIFKKAKQLSDYLIQKGINQFNVGFVPTMGALHQGHLVLINNSMKKNELTVCSIFVNPTQFNDPDDFKKYPVSIEEDIMMLESSGCQVLFLPSVSEIYPSGFSGLRLYVLGDLENILEGEYRPGHFQGVCQVVHRLLEIVQPDKLYIGQKDYQQCLVIKKLLHLTTLDKRISLEIVTTVRKSDGLAMSSRNKRLSDDALQKASEISRTLLFVKENIKKGNMEELIKNASLLLTAKGFKIDYLKIADAENLSLVNDWNGQTKIVVLAAAFIDGVRLIDNVILN